MESVNEEEVAGLLQNALNSARKNGYRFEVVADPRVANAFCVYEGKNIRCQGNAAICLIYLSYYASNERG